MSSTAGLRGASCDTRTQRNTDFVAERQLAATLVEFDGGLRCAAMRGYIHRLAVAASFFDLIAAFSSVADGFLISPVGDAGMPTSVISFVRGLYSGVTLVLVQDIGLMEFSGLSAGVLHGSPLSGTLPRMCLDCCLHRRPRRAVGWCVPAPMMLGRWLLTSRCCLLPKPSSTNPRPPPASRCMVDVASAHVCRCVLQLRPSLHGGASLCQVPWGTSASPCGPGVVGACGLPLSRSGKSGLAPSAGFAEVSAKICNAGPGFPGAGGRRATGPGREVTPRAAPQTCGSGRGSRSRDQRTPVRLTQTSVQPRGHVWLAAEQIFHLRGWSPFGARSESNLSSVFAQHL